MHSKNTLLSRLKKLGALSQISPIFSNNSSPLSASFFINANMHYTIVPPNYSNCFIELKSMFSIYELIASHVANWISIFALYIPDVNTVLNSSYFDSNSSTSYIKSVDNTFSPLSITFTSLLFSSCQIVGINSFHSEAPDVENTDPPISPIVSASFLLTSFSYSFDSAYTIFSLKSYFVCGCSLTHRFV